jgi:hypothetical protein
MKKLLLVACTLVGPAPTSFAGSFDEAFEAGWEAGWKYAHGQYSIVQIASLPPLQIINENDTYHAVTIARLLPRLVAKASEASEWRPRFESIDTSQSLT